MIIIGLDNGGGADSLTYIYGAVIVAGLFQLAIAPYFSKLVRFFPPVVTGTVITIIGITLIPVAAYDAGGGQFALYNPDLVPANLKFGSCHQPEPGVLHDRRHPAPHPVRPRLPLHRRRARRPGHRHRRSPRSSRTARAARSPSSTRSAMPTWSASPGRSTSAHPHFSLVPILLMIVVMLITAVETTGDVYATGQIVEKPISKSRHRRGAAGRRRGHLPRWHDELLPLHLLRGERRAGPADPGQEQVGGGHRRRAS